MRCIQLYNGAYTPPFSAGVDSGINHPGVISGVHTQSLDQANFNQWVLDDATGQLRMRLIAGKVLMDRNAPQALLDTAQSGYDQSKALIGRWHGRGRALYAITPRFAGSSTPARRRDSTLSRPAVSLPLMSAA